jgi:hypothetical protein
MWPAHGPLAVAGDLVRPVGVYEVVAGPADDDVGACRIVERVHHVVAAATGDLVRGGVEARAVVYQIVTVAAGDGVRVQRAGDLVFAGPAGDGVVAAAAVDLILTGTAREAVVAPGAEERGVTREKVLALQPDDRVVSGPTREPVRTIRTDRDRRQRHPARCRQHRHHHRKKKKRLPYHCPLDPLSDPPHGGSRYFSYEIRAKPRPAGVRCARFQNRVRLRRPGSGRRRAIWPPFPKPPPITSAAPGV